MSDRQVEVSFGAENHGSQVGQNFGTIVNDFHVSSDLSVGIAGALGTLFGVSSDAIHNASRSFAIEAQDLDVVFQAERLRYEKWGQAVGFAHGKLLDRHHVALDDPATFKSVAELLILVHKICSWGDEDSQQGVPAAGEGEDDSPTTLGLDKVMPSIQDKASQALRLRKEREGQVQFLGIVVQQLHGLVPPITTAGSAPKSASEPGQPIRRSNTLSALDQLDVPSGLASKEGAASKTPLISAETIMKQIAEFRRLIEVTAIEQQGTIAPRLHNELALALTP